MQSPPKTTNTLVVGDLQPQILPQGVPAVSGATHKQAHQREPGSIKGKTRSQKVASLYGGVGSIWRHEKQRRHRIDIYSYGQTTGISFDFIALTVSILTRLADRM